MMHGYFGPELDGLIKKWTAALIDVFGPDGKVPAPIDLMAQVIASVERAKDVMYHDVTPEENDAIMADFDELLRSIGMGRVSA